MGFFDWFKSGNSESKAIDSSAKLLEELFPGCGDSVTGGSISQREALQISTVFACLRVLANGMSQVPLVLYKQTGRNNNRAKSHRLYTLLHDSPNEYQTSYEFRYMLTLHLGLTNNAYVWVNRAGDRIIELLPLNPGWVSKMQDPNNPWGFIYTVTDPQGMSYSLGANEIVHLKNMPLEWNEGLNALSVARNALGLTKFTETYGSKYFSNGGKPSGIVSIDQSMDKEQRKKLRDTWEEQTSGIRNMNRVAVVSAGLKYTPISSNNDEGQFIETRDFQIAEVCRFFGVQPLMIFHSANTSTYASVEQMFIQHVTHTLAPWYANIEQRLTLSLLTPKERELGYNIKFLIHGLMRGAAQDRSEFYNRARLGGWMTINEIREAEGYNPIEGGDNPLTPLNSNATTPEPTEAESHTPPEEEPTDE